MNSPLLLDSSVPFSSPGLSGTGRADSIFSLGSPFLQQFLGAVGGGGGITPTGVTSVPTSSTSTSWTSSGNNSSNNTMMTLSPPNPTAVGGATVATPTSKRKLRDDSVMSWSSIEEESNNNNALLTTKKQRTRASYSLSLIPTFEDLSEAAAEGSSDSASRPRLDSEMLMEVLEMLSHSVECTSESDDGAGCANNKCATMKAMVAHAMAHEHEAEETQGRCEVCSRYRFILSLHARLCDRAIGRCRVPFCSRLKLEMISAATAEAGEGVTIADIKRHIW